MTDDQKSRARVVDVPAPGAATAITDRKSAEDLLREAQARTESVLASVADTHILFDRQWRYLYVNEAAVRGIGRPRDQILGRTLWELYPDIVGTELDRQYHRAMDERVPVSFDFYYPQTNAWWENRFFPAPEGLAVFATDITQRKQTDEKLREYEKVVEGLDEMIVVVDRDYRYLIANRAFLNYRDLKRDEVIGHSVSEFQDDATFEIVKRKLDECFQGKVVRYELRYSYPNLGQRDLFISYFPIEGPGGIDRAACIFHDITEQKRGEKALRKAEQKYRDIFENAGEGIFQTTPEGQYIEANPALARMHGFESPEELIRSLTDISREVYVDPARREEFKDLLEAQGFVRGFEHQIFRRDGSKIWVSINARAVRDEQGKTLYYEGTTQDINERKLAEARSAAFATLARELSGATTPLEAGRIIAETASELFGWDACNLDLYDADNDLVRPILNVDTIAGRRVDITASCVDRKPTARGRRVMDHGPELLLREDPIRFDPDTIPFGDTMRPSASIMTVSVRHASRIIGMLSIQSYAPRAYDAAALSDLQSLAEHCGEALNRIHAEQSFYESEERFRQMAEHFEDVVWLTDQDIRKILYVNPAYERVFRRTCESLYDRLESFLDAVHPEDRADVERMIEKERNGVHDPAEYRIVWPDGPVRWISRRSFPMRNTEGEVNLVAGIAQDITDRKRAECAQREAERKYRDIFENAAEGIFQTTPEGGFITVNPALARMLGYESLEELIRERRDIGLQGYVDPKGREEFRRLLETQDTVAGFEHQVYRRDRTKIWISENVRAVRDASGKLLYYEGTVEDITERKRAEKALRQSEVYFRSLIEHAADTISTYDANGVRLYTGPAMERVLGYKPEEMIGRSGFELLHPDDRPLLASLFAQTVQIPGVTVTKEFRCRHKDGTWRTLESTASNLLGDPAVGAVVLNSRDITGRRRAEEALRESEERYRDLVENSRELICTHDLDGLVLSANPAAAAALGYDLNDFVGKRNVRDILAPEVRHQFDEYMARVRRDGETSGIMLVQTSSGERRLWEFYNSLRIEGVAAPIVRGMARDITERKRAEEALRQSEREYRGLFENAHDAILIFHPEQEIILAVNQRACEIYGISRSEFIGMSLQTISENPHRGRLRINETLERGAFYNFETIQRRGDGTQMLLDINASVVQYKGQTAIQSINRDITDRKRAEESLQLFRNLINQSNDAIEVIDPITFRFIDCNESAYRSLGYSREEFLALTVFDIDPLVDPSMMARLDEEMKESGFANLESLHLRKDGTTFPVEVNVKVVRLERDYRLAVVRDITRRNHAEQALRASEERYRELFENAKDAIYVHDLSGRYVSLNRAAEKLSGYSRDEILGKHFSNFVAPKDLKHVRKNLCKKLDAEGETTYEIDLVTKDRRRVPVEVISRMIYENGELIGVQGTARDMTERRRAQEALQIYSRRLIEAQEAERQSLARELHDEIGQVLTAVRINLQTVQNTVQADVSRPRIEESIVIVDEALTRIRELSLELRPSLLDDLGLAAALRWYVDRYGQRTGILAEVLNGFEERGRLPRDLETECFRIAQEALTNVARHAQASRVSVKLEGGQGKLVLTITDNGTGFDTDNLLKTASAASTLGLRGMKERAFAMNGHVEIESSPGKGTHIRASFPLKRRN